jgi:tripartite-type tricarboxylate transporter receptor subunit TctC
MKPHPFSRMSCRLVLAAVALCFAATPALAQDYPAQPVKLVVPLTPGSGADIVARILSRKLQQMWNQTVVVENLPGAGGQIGTRRVVQAPADGLTLLVQSASHAANPAIYKKLPYDPQMDLIDVALLSTTPYVMVAASASPYKSVKDIAEAAKARPGALAFASAGVGSSTHLTAELFAQRAGISMMHVPFKGSPDAITDVAANRSVFYMAPLSTLGGMLTEDGRLSALAVTSAQRVAALPNVPTVAESGYPDVNIELWIGLWAPAGTKPAIIDKLSADLTTALQSPDVQAQFAKSGNSTRILTPAQFKAFVDGEIKTNKQLAQKAGIQVD